jgi:hypothetical protein
VGDSDDHLLPEEEEDWEDDASPFTSQDLLHLRRKERQRQRVSQAVPDALPEEDQSTEEFLPLPPSAASLSRSPRLTSASMLRRPADFFSGSPQRLAANAPRAALPPDASNFTLTGWRSVRLHSHWLIPVLLVLVFFFLLLFTRPQDAGAMLFIFAAIGLIQAAFLLYAPSDAFWAIAVVGGFVLMVSATFFVLFLPIFAVILSILLLALGVVALRERYYPVKESTVVVTSLFGKQNRTLQPGFNLRVPGEKVLGVVETHSIRHETPMPPILLVTGEQVTLSVAITYQVVPGEEYLAIRQGRDWQKTVQQLLRAVVSDEIGLLSIQDFRYPASVPAAQGAFGAEHDDDTMHVGSPLERINERLTDVMRQKLDPRGVDVHEVKIRLLENPHAVPGSVAPPIHQASPAPPHASLPQPTALPQPQDESRIVEGSVQPAPLDSPSWYPGVPFGMAGQTLPQIHPAGPPVAPPPMGTPQAGAPQQPMTLLSAQALAETYDAVVRHRISDMATIQRIISQFEAVAADPALSQQVPFDAEAGARNLTAHLHNLQMRSLQQLGQQNDTASPPHAPGGQDEQR